MKTYALKITISSILELNTTTRKSAIFINSQASILVIVSPTPSECFFVKEVNVSLSNTIAFG